jgi:hypothetical protein
MAWLEVLVVLRMWMTTDKTADVHDLRSVVAKRQPNRRIAKILSSDNNNLTHSYMVKNTGQRYKKKFNLPKKRTKFLNLDFISLHHFTLSHAILCLGFSERLRLRIATRKFKFELHFFTILG